VDYSSVTDAVSLIVSPALLTVTAANANRIYGQANPAFMGAITGVTNGDDITATYNCSATNSSPAGMYPIVPTLVDPGNRQTNYTVTLVDGTLTVGQAVAAVSWSNPAPITYGAAVTSIQLNATANVAGSFAYNPTNGSTLSAGTNTLTVVFTPAQTSEYNSASNTVSLVVSPMPLTIVSGVTANNKVYDGTMTATLSFNNVTLAGVVSGDTVSVNTNGYTANFASSGVGHEIPVTIGGLTLDGANAGNYTLTQPENLTAGITAPTVQIAGSVSNIVVSWTTNATAFVLQQTGSLAPPIKWSPVTNTVTVKGVNNTVVVNAATGFRYFELIAAP
jgi:hypothetical protein